MAISQAPIGFDDAKDYDLIITRQTRAKGASVARGQRVTVRGKEARLLFGAKKALRWDPKDQSLVDMAKEFEASQKKKPEPAGK